MDSREEEQKAVVRERKQKKIINRLLRLGVHIENTQNKQYAMRDVYESMDIELL